MKRLLLPHEKGVHYYTISPPFFDAEKEEIYVTTI